MDDYINREEAEKIFVEYSCVKYHVTEMGDTNEANRIMLMFRENAKKLFSLAPSADVTPVRHGRWIEYGENKDGTHNMRCSKCGAGLKSKGHANSYYTKRKYRYCRNCGAKMGEEEINE